MRTVQDGSTKVLSLLWGLTACHTFMHLPAPLPDWLEGTIQQHVSQQILTEGVQVYALGQIHHVQSLQPIIKLLKGAMAFIKRRGFLASSVVHAPAAAKEGN